jgi:gliding motility-associated-like protein
VWGGADRTLNCEVSEVTLQAQVLVGGAGVTYEWTDINGNVIGNSTSLLVMAPGRYFIRIYDPNVDCWSGKDGVDVLDLSNEPSAIIYADPGNILSCVIQFIVLSSEDEPDVSYTWIANGQAYTDSVLQIFEGGKVMLVARDTISKCESIDSITVDVLSEYPIINIAPVQPLTCERSSVTLNASGSLPGAGGIFTWTTPLGDTIGSTPMIQVGSPGEYILTLVDPVNGCTSDDTVLVVDLSESIEIAAAADVILPCDVNGGILAASLLTPSVGVSYQWQTIGGLITGSTSGAQISYQGAGTYIVTATNAAICMDADTIIVSAAPQPTAIEIESADASCESVADGSIVLGMIEGGTPPYALFVNGVETSQMLLEDLAPGSYLIQVEDVFGCMFETTILIDAGDDVTVDLETAVNIKQGESAELEAIVNIPANEIGSVVWSPSAHLSCDTCLVTMASPLVTTTYIVTVTDVYGCIGTARVLIRVADGTLIFIPNVITPGNGDDINEFITVFSNNPDTRIHSLRIFDRWGELVFARATFLPNVPTEGWDGTFKGKLVNPGVFVYKVELETRPGIIEILTGDVTVVR